MTDNLTKDVFDQTVLKGVDLGSEEASAEFCLRGEDTPLVRWFYMLELGSKGEAWESALRTARERQIIIPTLAEQKNPDLIPQSIKDQLRRVGLWEISPLNLFRITWHNEPVEEGGGFGEVNYLEFPPELTGVKARIVGLVGKWFPTGAHKVGAAFGCLVPLLVTGHFDPARQKAVWPSTGNYCRGGAYDSALLGCDSIAILPEGMSQERFEWLESVAGEIIKTPGSESNVKEIFDKCWELRESGEDLVIFNQFEEFGNYLWHYHVTGGAMEEVVELYKKRGCCLQGIVSSTGSAGTIACGDYLKQRYPGIKIAAGEALQCPTLLYNGFGEHRIEGIGDKHIPWIHNVRNTDMVIAIDDEAPVSLIRLFNEEAGLEYLSQLGIEESFRERLAWLGISSVANLLAAIKLARYFELGSNDLVLTVFTDSMDLYRSRLRELREEKGEYTQIQAAVDHHRYLLGLSIDNMLELTYYQRKRIHNLKYYTWVEQQGKTYEEIQAQWYDPDYWVSIQRQADELDEKIREFNQAVGLI